MRQWVGSILFTLLLFGSVPFYGAVALLTAPLPLRYTYAIAVAWVDSMFWLLRVLCRLDYVVEGREHLPARSSIVLLKHSSAWETLAQLKIFPRQTWVLKRELGVSVVGAPYIGDRMSDVEAADAVGARPMLVRTGTGAATVALLGTRRVPVFDDLAAAARSLLAETR